MVFFGVFVDVVGVYQVIVQLCVLCGEKVQCVWVVKGMVVFVVLGVVFGFVYCVVEKVVGQVGDFYLLVGIGGQGVKYFVVDVVVVFQGDFLGQGY